MSRQLKRRLSRYQDARILENLRIRRPAEDKPQGEIVPAARECENVPGEDRGEGPSGGHGGEPSQAVETMHAEDSGDTQSTTNTTSQE